MAYRITTLVENLVYGRELQAEHGLSLLIETAGKKILLDTGASGLFIKNARLLGIDLREVDFLILSHGHSDHTGGLPDFLSMNDHAKIICKKELFTRKFKDNRENGIKIPFDKVASRVMVAEGIAEIVAGIYVFPHIELADQQDTHFDHFYIRKEGKLIPDTFEDELAVALLHQEYVSVLSSCSHRGITNIIRTVRHRFPGKELYLVTGGFHIRNTADEKFRILSDFFKKDPPQRLGVAHCTGIDNFLFFIQAFGNRVFYNYTGRTEEIE